MEEFTLMPKNSEQKFIDEMNKLDIVDAKEKKKRNIARKVIQVVGGGTHGNSYRYW